MGADASLHIRQLRRSTLGGSIVLLAMEKIFKRARQAERQVVRRAKLREHRERIRTRIQVRDELRDASREHKSNMELARKIRQERWEMGPIAPRRQIGVNGYGLLQRTVHFDASVDGQHTPKRDLVVKRCAWAGGPKRLNLAVGDRVVIMDGVDKGRIDHIENIDTTFGTVTLRNIHKVCSVGEHCAHELTNPGRSSIGSARDDL